MYLFPHLPPPPPPFSILPSFLDVILLGLLLVGGSGFLHYLYGEVKVAVNLGAFRGDRGLDNPGLQVCGSTHGFLVHDSYL